MEGSHIPVLNTSRNAKRQNSRIYAEFWRSVSQNYVVNKSSY